MKTSHLIIAAGIMILSAGCGNSRNMSNTNESSHAAMAIEVPATIQTTFTTQYPTATGTEWSYYNTTSTPIDWELTDWQVLSPRDYVVSYNMDNNQYYAWYDANGNWIGSSSMITDYSKLPVTVNNMIASRYPGYTVTSAQTAYWKDRSAYQIRLKNNNDYEVKLMVDANGNILKEKTKSK